jgi:aryl-phospho-beta-D-glucosidase BglC (GH1 family)
MMKKLLVFFSLATFISVLFGANSAQTQQTNTLYRGMTYSGDSVQDLQDLRFIGANVVVYQIVLPHQDSASIESYRVALAEKLVKLDVLVEAAGQIGLPLIISLFTPPGGQNTTGVPPLHNMFVSKAYQDEFGATWQTLAQRYSNKTGVLAFDLLNEPQLRNVSGGALTWKELAPQVIALIHAIDPTRKIYIQPPFGNADLIRTKTALIKDPRVAYNIHTYFPSNFRTQGLQGRPINVLYPKGRLNRGLLHAKLQKPFTFQRKNKIEIIVGEFAAPRWAPKNSSARFLKDYIDIFERQGWSWMLHAWREADVWSIEHTNDPNNPNRSAIKTDRQILIERYFSRNG